jgi:hypothetical protein
VEEVSINQETGLPLTLREPNTTDDLILPELYSLRRSPFYQHKVTHQYFGSHLLNTRKDLVLKVTREAKSVYDIDQCMAKVKLDLYLTARYSHSVVG